MDSSLSNPATGAEPPEGKTSDLLLPPGTVLLHIGPRKTGTTAVQGGMHAARAQMRAHGVVYPGSGPRPVNPGRAVLGMQGRKGFPPPRMEDWQRYAGEVTDAADQRVCVSSEDFAAADDDKARRVVSDLGGARVHVVIAARRLDKLISSEWQEHIKARETFSYEEWLAQLLGGEPPEGPASRFWFEHDLPGLVGRWSVAAAPDRVSVIVLDPRDRDQLPRTFEQMLGLPTGLIQDSGSSANSSLSLGRAEIIRRVNRAFIDNKWSDEEFRAYHRNGLRKVLVDTPPYPGEQPIPPLPAWAAERVAEVSEQSIRDLEASGVRLLGADLGELRTPAPAPPEAEAVHPDGTADVAVSPELAALAVEGVIAAARQRDKQRAREWAVERERLERELASAQQEAARLKQKSARSRLLGEAPASSLARELRRRARRRARTLLRRHRPVR